MAKPRKSPNGKNMLTQADADCRAQMERFSKNWDAALKASSYSLQDLCRLYGYSRQNIQGPLKSSNATMITLNRLAIMVGYTVEELLFEKFTVKTELVRDSEATDGS